MNTGLIERINQFAASVLTPFRYRHTLNVLSFAESRYKSFADPEKIKIVCLLHDIGKDMDSYAVKRYGVTFSGKKSLWKSEPYRHCFLACRLAEILFGIKDQEILAPVLNHSTGQPGFSTLGKILVVSDMCSIDRKFPGVLSLRRMADCSLDKAYLEALKIKITFVLEDNRVLLPEGIASYNDQLKRMSK